MIYIILLENINRNNFYNSCLKTNFIFLPPTQLSQKSSIFSNHIAFSSLRTFGAYNSDLTARGLHPLDPYFFHLWEFFSSVSVLWVASKPHEEKFSREKTSLNRDVSFNSGLALQACFATKNSDVVIFVKIIKENLWNALHFI